MFAFMRTTRLAAVILCACLTLVLVAMPGCGKPAGAEAAGPEAKAYTGPPAFTVINDGRRPIRAVALRTNMMISFRDLGPGEASTLSSKSLEITDKVECRWTDHRGEHHYKKLSSPSSGRSGNHLRFVIDGSNRVEVVR